MVEPRKGPQDKEAATSRHEVSHSASSEEIEQYVFTLNATTREVVNVERLAPGGHHRAISDDEWTTLASGDEVDAMMGAAQDAYAAGLIEGLKRTPEDDPDEEFAVLQLLGDRANGVKLLGPELRLALERRLLLRRLLRRYLLQTPSDPQQRRMPIAKKAINGSASGV